MDEIVVIVEPPTVVEVKVEPALPDVNVKVESSPEVAVQVDGPQPSVDVHLWQVALAGRNGADGRDGVDGNDGGATATALANHISDPTPHPAYDDGPSLILLYENAKV